MKFLNHGPLKGKKLQFMGGIMGLSICQTPSGIGNDGIGPIVTSLVEDSPQVRPASVSVQFKRIHKIGVGKNGHCDAQVLQIIKGPLASVIPGDGHPHLTCVLARCQNVQRLEHMHEHRDEVVIVSCDPKKAPDLSDGGGEEPFSNSIYFTFVGCYS